MWLTVLKIVCMFCKKEMGEQDGGGVEGVTSSICEECWAEHFPGVPYPEEDSQNRERRLKENARGKSGN